MILIIGLHAPLRESFDADCGKELAVEAHEYDIPDCSNWKSYDAFEQAFTRLYADLKASA